MRGSPPLPESTSQRGWDGALNMPKGLLAAFRDRYPCATLDGAIPIGVWDAAHLDVDMPTTDHREPQLASGPMEPWFLRAGWRLYATLLLVLAVPTGLLLATVAVPVQRQIEVQARRQNELLSQLLAVAVDEELGGLTAYLESMGSRPLLAAAAQARHESGVVQHLKAMVQGNPRITRAFLADIDGVLRYDYPHDPAVINVDFSHRDWFQGVAGRQGTYVSEIYRRSALGQPFVVSIASPLRDAEGRTIGYLVGQYPLDDLRGRIAALSPLEAGSLAIIDQHGNVAAGVALPRLSLADLSPLTSRVGPGVGATISAVDREGSSHLVSYCAVPTAGWTAVAHRPAAVIYAPLRSLLRTIVLLFIACFLGSAAIGSVLYRTLQRYGRARRRAEDGLREAIVAAEDANRAKSEFLAVMSHELRTPLNGVIGMTELLRGTGLDERQSRFLEACHESAHSLLALINDILDLSKIDANRLEIDCDEFALHQCIDDSVALMAHRAHAKGLELSYYVDPGLRRRVLGDHVRVRQVLVNLLSNAIKFTDAGHVALRAGLDEQDERHMTVRCSVTDTGIGIPAGQVGQLFQSFSQLNRTNTRKFGGTGLGLAISRSLTQAMGGRIGVESAEGEGSTFWFTFRVQRIADGSCDLLLAPFDLKNLRVLIVSESDAGRDLLAQTFLSWDIRPDAVAADEHALDRIEGAGQAHPPLDLIVIDLPVAGPDAAELAKRVVQASRVQAIPIFVLAPANAECAADFLGATVLTRCLRKPPSASELLNALVDAFCATPPAARPAPHRPNDEAIAAPARPQDHGRRRRRGRVLIVEDNDTSRLYVQEVLARAGFDCDVATTGVQAVTAVRAATFDVALMDCHMPEMDGFDATAAIRALEADGTLPRRLPIIALTANAIRGDRERCLAAGMDDYLSKPVVSRQLLEKVEAWISPEQDERGPTDVAAPPSAPAAGETAPVQTSARPSIDIDTALSRFMGDAQFLLAALQTFADETPKYVEQVRSSLAAGDAPAAGRAAHSIKGAAGLINAAALRDVAAELESLGREARLDEARARVDRLRLEMDGCLRFIEDHRARSQATNTGETEEMADAGPDRR